VYRIAIDVRGLEQSLRNSPAGGLGGPGRYAFALLRALLSRDDFSWLLLTDRGPIPGRLAEMVARRQQAAFVCIGLPQPLTRLRYTRFAFRVDTLEGPLIDHGLRASKASVVHTPAGPWTGHFRPAVGTLHDTGPLAPAGLGSRKQKEQWARYLKHYQRHEAVICVSRSTAGLAQAQLGIDPGRIIICPPALDDTFLWPPSNGRDHQRSRQPYFLHVGNLGPRKNPKGLLHAFAALAGRCANAKLVCVGPYQTLPSAATYVRRLADRLSISRKVELLDDCDDAELLRLYRGAVALVFPSFWEGFGLPVAEALASGTPCIASNRGGLPEAGGSLALYVDPCDHQAIADAMLRTMVDEDHRARVRREGPRWAQQFESSRVIEPLLGVYEDVARSRR